LSVRNLILSGGPGHPFADTTACVADILSASGVESDVTDDIEAGTAALGAGGYRLLTINALRWRMLADRYAPQRVEWAYSPSPEARRAIRAHLDRGGGLLALHTAPICFDDWPEWGDIVGAHWDWDTSRHPALGEMKVWIGPEGHEIVDGLEPFGVVDEAYAFMALRPDVTPLLTTVVEDTEHPLLWARTAGNGRVVYDALGHDHRAYEVPAQRTILQRAARWLTPPAQPAKTTGYRPQ
jgi:type 1 glutamine amidotransferase